jgi:hypothetical protein
MLLTGAATAGFSAAFDYQHLPQSLSFKLNSPVSSDITAAALQLTDISTGATVPASSVGVNPSTNTVTFEFAHPLADGNYSATLLSSALDDAGAQPTAVFSYDFFALTGDVNHDGSVGFPDLLLLAQHYGRAGSFAQGDLNYDSSVNFADLLILAQDYGHKLPVPGPVPAIATTSLPNATAGASYVASLAATENVPPGTPAPTFTLLSGPAGLTVSPAGEINWTPTAAQIGTQSLSVQVANPFGLSSSSLAITVTHDITPPTPPILTLGTIDSATSIPLSWAGATDNVGVAGYRVYQWFPAVYTGHSGRGGGITLVSPAKYVLLADNVTGTSYTVTGLTPNSTYHFAVSAFDAAGNQSAYSDIVTGATLQMPSFSWSTTGSNVDPPLSVVANHPLSVLVFPSGVPFPSLDVSGLPAGATFLPGIYTNSQLTYRSPTINWTPTDTQVGSSSFTIAVTNSVGSYTQTIPVIVTAEVPAAPAALGLSASPSVRRSRSAPAHRLVARTRVHGLATGSYTTPFTLPDLGHEYDFTGTGTIAPLGGVAVAGRINTPGFIASGFAAGQLTLTSPAESVTLSLKGPRESGFGPLPRRLAFTVASATGRYHGMHASGHVTIHLNPNAKTFVMVFGN